MVDFETPYIHQAQFAQDSNAAKSSIISHNSNMIPFLSFPIIKSCNYACLYCGKAGEATASNVSYMTIPVLKQISCTAKIHGIKKFRITGGEPFLHPSIDTILQHFNELGIYTLVNSNGSVISKWYDLLDTLDSSVIQFAISLDTLNNSKFNIIARPKTNASLTTVMESLRLLSNKKLLLRINMVVGHHNIDEVSSMIEFCKSLRCSLKLLDIVSVPLPYTDRDSLYLNLSELESELCRMASAVYPHSYSNEFGVPCVRYSIGGVEVTVKNGSHGTRYDVSGICKNCEFFPCHEGLYDIFALPDGKICPCRWVDKQIFSDLDMQLDYMIKSFQQSVFIPDNGKILKKMKKRSDLLMKPSGSV